MHGCVASLVDMTRASQSLELTAEAVPTSDASSAAATAPMVPSEPHEAARPPLVASTWWRTGAISDGSILAACAADMTCMARYIVLGTHRLAKKHRRIVGRR